MDRMKALGWLAEHRNGVLATLKRDGRPQLSNIVYGVDGEAVRISVTADRAKTRNVQRDARVSLHVTTERFWPYVVAEGVASLSPVASAPDDPTVDELADLYRSVSGEHPDWDEFRQAMVDQRRQVLRFPIDRLYGLEP